MEIYRERLSPTPWLFVATALLIPASLLVFLPISMVAGVVAAVVSYGLAVVILLVTTPRLTVTETEFVAGRARLPREVVGEVSAHRGADATLQRGRELDARAWLLIRGWISPVVKVRLVDETDPTPYWLVSTRRPDELVAALTAAPAAAAPAD
ncbi:DUF3093 domain-containing protein [Schumannella sp. 10F1B-5-1]|uniref:DUF3093 domain-containing protein n=1 Tax=Schumannella sp. 10F1B-5-1 TaxID=2590780 RepID=UPI001131E91C|nr:DUF3093 domain-containing protein [Schumannella sp. 10F1B-5-1]TPW70877.1 DUF3093 domain-containing protein [Schumannella sp. 10F1B-5-1]